MFDHHVEWWIFGRNLSLRLELKVFDVSFDLYLI
jgi:hypothetical protein